MSYFTWILGSLIWILGLCWLISSSCGRINPSSLWFCDSLYERVSDWALSWIHCLLLLLNRSFYCILYRKTVSCGFIEILFFGVLLRKILRGLTLAWLARFFIGIVVLSSLSGLRIATSSIVWRSVWVSGPWSVLLRNIIPINGTSRLIITSFNLNLIVSLINVIV